MLKGERNPINEIQIAGREPQGDYIMAIKIYSDKTNKYYDTVQAAEDAEFKLKEQENRDKILAERKAAELKEKKEQEAAERKAAADKVEAARKVMVEAQRKYREELEAFIKQYKTYHYSSNKVEDIPILFDLFDWL